MRFSILIPTRNRLDLLKYAVETVRRQDYDDWEIVISDNCSEEDIAGFVRSLGDVRIKYFRTETFLPVTENWNNALYHSAGDYFIMLGDDDCLMQGCLSTLSGLIDAHGNPDFIYMRAFLYAYPRVLPDIPGGLLRTNGCARFFTLSDDPFLLNRTEALNVVEQSMNLRQPLEFNMQHSAVSRRFANSLKGNFFQSPYPDFYATNVLFFKAGRILICPLPLVTVGISPKSFGFYYFNDREGEGVDFLKNISDPEIARRLESVLLPGSDMNSSWLLAMETIRSQYGLELGLAVNYRRYRMLQVVYIYEKYYLRRTASKEQINDLRSRLTNWEKLSYEFRIGIALALQRVIPPYILGVRLIQKLMGLESPYPQFDPERCKRSFDNILEVFEQVKPEVGLRYACKR